MNKHSYRLVFNKAKGLLVVASEVATTQKQGGKVTPRRRSRAPTARQRLELGTLRPLRWSILLALGLVSLPVHAQISPDRTAPSSQRPHVLESANGTPQVNITTPNAKGVSRNAYRQFDVDSRGTILNNSRAEVATQIGGWVQGNPNLANGEARVIVNEINSSNPSRLHGAVEVAGRRAEVVIANPAGIDVDGAGFINAQGVTLTTGQPQFSNGALGGYRVEGGTVRIHGNGFDAGDADYAAVLARAAEIQAGMWGEELDVIAGANRISADRQTIDTIDGNGESPSLAIDVAHLGGMYAGKINLMATERGVGVYHAGDMAADEIMVAADGRITNRGKIASQGDMHLVSHDDIANYGAVRAGDDLVVTSDDEIANRGSGKIIARDDIQLSAATLSSNDDTLVAAGVRNDGVLGDTGDLSMSATQSIEGSGRHTAAGGFYAQAETVELRDSHTQARDIDITAGEGGIDATGATLTAQRRLRTTTPGTLRTDHASVAADELTLDVDSLSNIGGDMAQLGEKSLALRLDAFDNTSGRLASNSGLDIAAHALTNTDGTLQAVEDNNINAANLNNRGGDIVAGNTLFVKATGDIDNTQGQWRAERVDVAAAGLNNSTGLISANGGELLARVEELDNTQGRLESANNLTLDIAHTLTNEAGEIVHAGQGKARIDAMHIDGSGGLIASQGELTLDTRNIVLDSATTSAESLALHAENLSHRQGEMLQLSDANALTLDVDQTMDNTGGLIASNAGLDITANALTSTDGTLQAVEDVNINAASLNNRGGDIVAGISLAVKATGDIENTQGQWRAARIDVDAKALGNNAGLLSANGGELYAQLDDLNNTQGRLESEGDLTLDIADTLNNQDGEIVHAGEGIAHIGATRLEGSDGLIASRGELTLDAKDIALDGADTSAESITLRAKRLSHRQSEMQQFGDADALTLEVEQTMDNTGGLIASNAGLDITANALTSTDGTLQAVEDVNINAASLNNRGGDIVAGNSLAVKATGDIENTQGQWRAARIDVDAMALGNNAGLLSANGGELYAQLDDLNNTQGRLESEGDLTLDIADTLINQDGEIVHAGEGIAHIGATRLEGSDGLIASQGELTLDAKDTVLDGAATSAESLALHAANLSHRQGEMLQLGDADALTLEVDQAMDNTGGLIASNAGLDITANALTTTDGTLQAVEDININAASLNNRGGDIAAGNSLAVKATGDIENTQGQWRAARIDVDAKALDNNAGLLSANGGELYAQLADLYNTQGRLESEGDLTLDIADTLINQDGEIVHAGEGVAHIGATRLEGSDSLIASRGELTLDAKDIVLDGADTSAESITLRAKRLSHRQGKMQQFGDADALTLDVDQAMDNTDGLIASNAGLDIIADDIKNIGGTLQAIERLQLDTGDINNRGGELVTGGRLTLDATGSVDNRDGDLIGEQGISLRAASLDSRSGMLGALEGELVVEVGTLDNTQGRVETAGNLSLDIADALTNEGGEIVHAGDGEANIGASLMDGSDGLIASQGELTLTANSLVLDGAITSAKHIAVQADSLSHRQGEMSQQGSDTELQLAIRRELDNHEGSIVSHADLSLSAADIVNHTGTLQAAGDINLDSGKLDNRQGKILAGGGVDLDASGRLDNTKGRVVANSDADLSTSSLVNADGTLASLEGDLALEVIGSINNLRGRIEVGDELSSVSRSLNNRYGEIVATKGDIDTQQHRLDNRGGMVATRKSLELSSGAFENAGGTLQAGGDLSLDTHGQALLNTANGSLLGEGDVLLTLGGLNNTTGLIGAGSGLDLQAGEVINRNGGALLSETGMHLEAATLDNRDGQLQALGDLSLGLDGTLNNQSGLIRAGQKLELGATQVFNQYTKGDDQGIEGHAIQLEAGNLDNRQGTIRADQLADINVDAGVNNRGGLISSLDKLALEASDIDNRGGTLIADKTLDLATTGLTGEGRVLSLGDLALQIASDFTLNRGSELMAAGDLLLDSTGMIDNQGKLKAGDTLSIGTTRLNNAASGELSGSTTHIDTAHLTNRGLIDGVDTHIAADVLDNLGTGRVYGDRLAIEAGTLTNDKEEDKAAVIAARERLDLGVDGLINRDDALIFSAGDMAIGGSLNARDKARGQADLVKNASATIEALGNLNLSTARLDNTNEHFETALVWVADLSQGLYLQPNGWDEKLLIDEFEWVSTGSYTDNSGRYRHKESGVTVSGWTEYNIERAQYESQVVSSQPGQLLVGGNLHLSGGDLINDKSRVVAGGGVYGDLNNLSNIEAVGQRTFDETGTSRESSTYTRMECMNGQNCGPERVTYRRYSDWEPYSGQSSEAIIVPITEVREGNTVAGSGVQLDAHNGASLDASAQGAHGAQVNLQASGASGGVIEVPALLPATNHAESSLASSDRQRRQREDFKGVAAIPDSLIQTRTGINAPVKSNPSSLGGVRSAMPAITLPANSLLQNNPSPTARYLAESNPASLGIIRSVMPAITLPANSLFQINPAPTARYLVETDPRFTDRREWLGSDYMLDSMNHKPSTTHKRLGDGFYEQRLVNEQIMQVTGQRYLAGHSNDDDQYRALMDAGVTFAEEFNLRPGVALTDEQMAQLTSDIVWLVEQEVTQEDGSITKVLVPQVYARVREGDLKGDGTLIAGNSLALDVKNDIVNTGTLAGRELVDMTAGNLTNLEGRISGNRVDLRSRRDLTNLGGNITANESMSLQAGRDLNLASTSERLAGLYVTEAGGSLSAAAGRDLSVLGADLDSAGNLQLGAGRDLDIASTMSQETRWGGISERSELEHGASLSAGSDLILNAGRDLTMTAVDASAGGDGLLSAGRDLALETLTPQESLKTWRNTHQESEEVGTELDVDGSLALLAGQDIDARASQLKAGDDLALSAGRDISLEAGYSQQYEETRQDRTHTIDSQSRVQSTTLDAGGDLFLQAGNDLSLTATQLQAGQEAALMAGGDIDLLTAQEHDYSFYEKESSGGLFGGSRTQRDEISKTRAIGSEVNTGGDLLIASGQDQTYQAARLESEGDIALQSGGTIRFETASDMHTESHERSKSNFAWQSASGEGFTRETLRQSELLSEGNIQLQAEQGIHALYAAQDGESLDQAIERVVSENSDLEWLKSLQGRNDVTWESIEALNDEWQYSQSGLSPVASAIVAAVISYYTAGAASGAIGSLSGTAAGSGATFSAATGSTVAGWGNAALSGAAGGAVGNGVGAYSQGADWQEAAWRGGVTGGFTGYLSGGTYYENPIHTAKDIGSDLAAGNLSHLANTARHLGMQQVYGELQQKMADGVGLSADELNWLLMASSITGDALIDDERARYKWKDRNYIQSDQVGGRGWLHRGSGHVGFDAVDTALTYQDLPTNTVHNYLYDLNRAADNTAYTGHSLGTGDGAYLGRHGLVENAYLHSVPFGIVAPSNAEVTLGSWDLVNGGFLGRAFNWNAKVEPLLPWEHGFDNYKRFIEVGD